MKSGFQARNPMEGHDASFKSRMNSIAGLLSPADVLLDLDVSTSTRVFEEAGRLFEQRHGLSRAQIVQRLIERESIGSTGLGLGIALPHARIDDLSEAVAAFVALKVPVPFDAPDAKPVSHLLIFLAPERATEHHLQMLAEIAQLFGDRGFREQMRSCDNPEAVCRLFAGDLQS
jgi:nitrogen PTS system EIIA component